jgi:type I restriction enzyme M protein
LQGSEWHWFHGIPCAVQGIAFMASKPAAKKESTSAPKDKSFEQTLWATADKLRGSVESSEYKHVVLSLIFLKFISDKFNQRKQQLINEGLGEYRI